MSPLLFVEAENTAFVMKNVKARQALQPYLATQAPAGESRLLARVNISICAVGRVKWKGVGEVTQGLYEDVHAEDAKGEIHDANTVRGTCESNPPPFYACHD